MIQSIDFACIQESLLDWQQIPFDRKITVCTVQQCNLSDEQCRTIAVDLDLVSRPIEIGDDVARCTSMVGVSAIFTPTQIAEIEVTTLICQLTIAFADIIHPSFGFGCRR